MARAHERRRAGLLLELAVEDEVGVLLDAKAAHAEQGTQRSRAEKRAAMASLAETRQWLRALDKIQQTELELAELDGKTGQDTAETRAALQAQLDDLHERYVPLIQAMTALGDGGSS